MEFPYDPSVSLIHLAAAAMDYAAGRYKANRQLAELNHELEIMTASALGGTLVATGHTDGEADVVVISESGELLAVEIKVLRYSATLKSFRNRLQELKSTSASLHRSMRGYGEIVCTIGVIGASCSTWAEVFNEPSTATLRDLVRWIEESLLKAANFVGYDRISIGLIEGDDWLILNKTTGREVVSGFTAMTAVLEGSSLAKPEISTLPLPTSPRKLRFLLVADEWKSTHGGISTVNRELAVALAGEGVDVTVVVPAASSDDRDSADAAAVNLVSPAPIPGLSERELLCTKPIVIEPAGAKSDYEPDVIVGHGRILGPFAMALQSQFYPRALRVHIVHTDAEQLEAAKEIPGGPSRMELAEERRALEVDLAMSADLVLGVGPLLTDAIEHAMRGQIRPKPRTAEMTPGMRDWGGTVDETDLPRLNQVLVLARAEDPVSKGLDIAAGAVVRASAQLGTSQSSRPSLVIRGVPSNKKAKNQAKAYLESVTKPTIDFFLRPFSEDDGKVRADLWQSKVVLMPSRHEGFGLAALEAIAAGVPVLISAESGLAQLLARILDEDTLPEILPTHGDPSSIEELWGAAVTSRLKDCRAAFRRAKTLREQLVDKVSWKRTAEDLVAALLDEKLVHQRDSGLVTAATQQRQQSPRRSGHLG